MSTRPVALVTGGSSGIGLATAVALGATHDVWLTYNRGRAAADEVVERIVAAGGHAHAVQLDASDPASIEALAVAFGEGMNAEGRPPRLDALVANAAFFGDSYRLLFELEEDEWDRVWATNTTGVIRLTRAFLDRLLPGGTIVHLSTISVPVGAISYKSHAHYTTSKAATSGFLDGLAETYAAQGLQCVNLISGLIQTRMLRESFGDDVSTYGAEIPMKRFGAPEEIARVIVRLVSSPRLPIGRIAVDGGWLQKGWARL